MESQSGNSKPVRASLDRLLPALLSSDLSVTDHLDNAHFVAALGYAGKDYPIASPLIRMYLAHDKAAVHEARRVACDMASQAARRQGVRLRMADLVAVGRTALDYVVNKTCPRCHGTKYELISGTNRLGDHPCRACHGDGRREVPRHHRKLIVEVISRIERIEATLDTIVAKRV